MRYQRLDWDSDFFGIGVARIIPARLSREELTETLTQLRQQHVTLAYWFADQEFDHDVITSLGGVFVDRKTTFVVDLRTLHFDRIPLADRVEPFADPMAVADLQSLAIQSGEFSRFAVDPNLPKDKFVALYKVWIDRSIRKDIASEVLVIRDGDTIAGMVTLGEKNARGAIGLIAVDSRYRGRKYGEALVRAAQRWFATHGYEYGQVVTQGQNVAACYLYEKCGYSVERVECVYHFWMP